MRTNSLLIKNIRTIALCFSFFLFTLPLVAAPQDVDLTGPSPNVNHTFNLAVSTLFTSNIGVLNPDGNVFWEFDAVPAGATSTDGFVTNFSINGITVTLPLGTPNAVASALTAIVNGTPLLATSHSFRIKVADEDNPALTRIREYELLISQPMDLVLVLDRSGSMNTITGSGVSRWDALKNSAANFVNMYQALNRTGDRIGITYFETDLTPVSACCNGLIPVTATVASTINADIAANTPGGSTGMGSGLKNAINTKLTDATKSRSVLLITDGEQNTNPLVNLNGLGYSDGDVIPGGLNNGDVKIFTIGIGSPSGDFHTTLQQLATKHRGSYNTTDDGSAFTFVAGGADLSSGFTDQFVSMLSKFSPQLIERSSTSTAGTGPFNLQTFPLNKRVNKLLLEFTVNRSFETAQIVQLLARIVVKKDGVVVTPKAKLSLASNYTNTILLTFDFENQSGSPVLTPEGEWSVALADVSSLNINYCKLTSLADDHRLHINRSLGDKAPKVNDSLPLTVSLDWMSHPITDATVEALILRPGEDWGDFLANYPFKGEISNDVDAGSPGLQKFEKLWATDSVFRNKLERKSNTIPLSHTSDGNYKGNFSGLTVAGVYKIIFLISGSHPDAGKYKRFLSESFYTSFSSLDLSQSAITSQIVEGKLVMNIKPITSYGKLVGPAMGKGFGVSTAGVSISDVVDHQDGRYTITFTGDVNSDVTLTLLNQEIYKGKLSDAGKQGTSWWYWIINYWYIWLVLLIIFILWIAFKKK